MQWRHISILVTSQLPIQATKFAIISFQRALVPPTLKKFPPPMAKCIAAGWNGFTGQIWPVSRCVKNPDIDWRVVTAHTIAGVQHQSWTVVIYLRRHGHNFLSRNTVTWRPARGTSQHRTPQHPQNVSRGTQQCTFPRSTKHVYTYLACSQDFSKICWSGKLFCSATAATKTALGIIQLWFNYFRGIMACTRDATVVGSFTPVSLFVYGDDRFANLLVPFQNAMPLDTQPTGVLSSPNSLSNFSRLASSSGLAAASESLLLHSSTEAFTCAKLRYSAWKTLPSSVRWGADVDKNKAACLNFLFS